MTYSAISFGATAAQQARRNQLGAEFGARWQVLQQYLNRLVSAGLDADTARMLQTAVDNVGQEINLLDPAASDDTAYVAARDRLLAAENAVASADTAARNKLPWNVLGWGALAVGAGILTAVFVISRSRPR